MPTIHIVEKCEHISELAERFGFSSFRTIWDHPDNAELKQKRRDNPHILAPGDRVVIPDREEKEETRGTDSQHVFQVSIDPIELRVRLLDLNDKPIQGPCFLEAGGNINLMRESGDTFISAEPIPPDLKQAKMNFPQDKDKREVALRIGCLEPIDTPSGQRDRLNNLGYFAGFSRMTDDEIRNNPQFIWAVEEFQCDNGIKPQKPVCDQKTQDKLEKVHGC